MAKKKRKQRGDTMQDVTQKPQASEAEEAVETMEAAVETAMDADEAHEQAKEEMAQDTAAAEAAEALAAAVAKQEEYLAMAQRVQADFENFRRRNQNVRKEAFDDGARAFATTLLPVIDNLERAITAAGKNAGEGEPGMRGGPAGDLYITVTVKPHRLFKRDGNNILLDMPISITQAALGAEIDVPTLEKPVKQRIPEGTQTGTQFRIKGQGIPSL